MFRRLTSLYSMSERKMLRMNDATPNPISKPTRLVRSRIVTAPEPADKIALKTTAITITIRMTTERI